MLYSYLDNDNSATIDTPEMYQVLEGVFGDELTSNEVVALTDYLMTTVTEQQGLKHGVRN